MVWFTWKDGGGCSKAAWQPTAHFWIPTSCYRATQILKTFRALYVQSISLSVSFITLEPWGLRIYRNLAFKNVFFLSLADGSVSGEESFLHKYKDLSSDFQDSHAKLGTAAYIHSCLYPYTPIPITSALRRQTGGSWQIASHVTSTFSFGFRLAMWHLQSAFGSG